MAGSRRWLVAGAVLAAFLVASTGGAGAGVSRAGFTFPLEGAELTVGPASSVIVDGFLVNASGDTAHGLEVTVRNVDVDDDHNGSLSVRFVDSDGRVVATGSKTVYVKKKNKTVTCDVAFGSRSSHTAAQIIVVELDTSVDVQKRNAECRQGGGPPNGGGEPSTGGTMETATATPTATQTPTTTSTSTQTSTPDQTPTATSTPTPTPTSIPTPTATATPTPTPTATSTPTSTATSTPAPTETSTPTPTATSTPSQTAPSTEDS